jgi:hypothetical protein
MKKGYRNSYNEQVATNWRNRKLSIKKLPRDSARGASRSGPASADREFEGALLVDKDVYDLVVRAASVFASQRAGIASITETFCTVFGDPNGTEDTSMVPDLDLQRLFFTLPETVSPVATRCPAWLEIAKI